MKRSPPHRRRSALSALGLTVRAALRGGVSVPPVPPPTFRTHEGLTVRAFALRPDTYDPKTHSVEAVLATEAAVRVLDLATWDILDEVLRMDGARLPDAGQVPLLDTHDRSTIRSQPGSTRALRIEGDQLVGRRHFAATQDGQDAESKVRDGHLTDGSIGYQVLRAVTIEAGQTAEVEGRTYTAGPDRPLRVALEWAVREDSLCSIGADGAAKVRAVPTYVGTSPPTPTSNGKDSNMTFDQWLAKHAIDAARCTPAEMTALRACFDADNAAGREAALAAIFSARTAPAAQNPPPPATAAPPLPSSTGAAAPAGDATRAAADPAIVAAVGAAMDQREAAAAARVTAIRELADFGQVPAAALDHAIAQGMTVDAARAHFLAATRAARGTGADVSHAPAPAIHIHAGRGEAAQPVLEAALCRTYHVDTEARLLAEYGPETMNRTDALRGLGLRELAAICAASEGIRLPRAVGGDYMRRAASTLALPGILGNVANKAVAGAFLATRQIAPRISRPVSVRNFHTQTVYSLALNGDLELVGNTGQLDHLNAGEESWTRKLQTRGAVLRISRQDWIDDDAGAFVDNGQRIGRKCVLSRERATGLLVNATGAGASFFTTDHANYISGAATNLQHAALSQLVTAFRNQTGPDGDPVSIEPRILVVPPELEEIALALMDPNRTLIATALGSTAAAKKEPAANVWAGKFSVEVWEWLNKTIAGTAGSTTAWYLFASPADVAAVEIAYLDGNQQPTLEFFGISQDVDVLGMSWRAFWDFAPNLAEFRAAAKSKGAA